MFYYHILASIVIMHRSHFSAMVLDFTTIIALIFVNVSFVSFVNGYSWTSFLVPGFLDVSSFLSVVIAAIAAGP